MTGTERKRAGAAGVVAAALAVTLPELLAGLIDSVPSLVIGVGGFVVDIAPPVVKDVAISLFGTSDKVALSIGIAVLVLVIGWFTGIASRRDLRVGIAVFAVFGIVGMLAAAREPEASLLTAALAAAVGVVAGIGSLVVLLGALGPSVDPAAELATDDSGRRRFLALAGAGAGVAVVSGVVGRRLISSVPEAPPMTFPTLSDPLPAIGTGQGFTLAGVSPIEVPSGEFYRIDTALVIPRVDTTEWNLRVHGLVERELNLTYEDLLSRDLVERWVTLSCVSNPVGGDLVGNARWIGVPLTDILDEAGVLSGGTQMVGRSIDGWTAGFPTTAAYEGRDPLIALGMNGEVLPRRHGYPARLVVPGLYGFVSATKWITEIELTGWDDFDAYWIKRGWSKEAPIKTQSRIDVPGDGNAVGPGPVPVAGVAWAPTRGVDRVEIRVDGGAWIDAEVTEPLSDDAWVQWRTDVEFQPGDRLIEVRATDGNGVPQTPEERSARPDGASGYHRVKVSAR